MISSQCRSKLQIEPRHQLTRSGQLLGEGMLTSRRDQADCFIAWSGDPLIFRIIARLILGKVGVVPNQGGHRAHALHTGSEIFLVKGGAVFLQAGVSKSDVGRV